MKNALLVASLFMVATGALAGEAESEAALTKILWDEEMENVSYKLRSNGFIDITFGSAVKDEDYSRILNKLQHHPDIPGVLAGRGGTNYCPVK